MMKTNMKQSNYISIRENKRRSRLSLGEMITA